MILPEVRVIIERAATTRFELEGLLEVVPEAAWEYPSIAEGWFARTHLGYLVATDLATAELSDAAEQTQGELWVGSSSSLEAIAARLAESAAEASAQPIAAIRDELGRARRRLAASFAELSYQALERDALLPGQVDAWGAQRSMSMRQYLTAWLAHEPAQIAAIRAAIAKPPDMSAVSIGLARRRRS